MVVKPRTLSQIGTMNFGVKHKIQPHQTLAGYELWIDSDFSVVGLN